MPPISHILVSSTDLSINPKNRIRADLPDFQVNRIVEASVSRVLSLRQVELLLQGKKIQARTYVPLQEGDTLLFKAVKQGRQQILKLIEVRREDSSGKHDDFLMRSIPNDAGRDLKILSERYLNHLPGNEAVRHPERTFLKSFEGPEIPNKYAGEEPIGRYLLPLPFPFDETLRFGQMLLDPGWGKNSGKRLNTDLIRVSFLLEMSEMGDVRADFSIFKQRVAGSFGVANNDICSLIEGGVTDLTENLNKHGFEVQEIICRVVHPEILAATSLVAELTDKNQGILNLFI